MVRCFTFSNCHSTPATINGADGDPRVKHFEATKGPDGITRRDPNYFCVIAEQYFPPESIPPSVNAVTLFTAYGNDYLYIALGDGDTEGFTDNVAADVRPSRGRSQPSPCFVGLCEER